MQCGTAALWWPSTWKSWGQMCSVESDAWTSALGVALWVSQKVARLCRLGISVCKMWCCFCKFCILQECPTHCLGMAVHQSAMGCTQLAFTAELCADVRHCAICCAVPCCGRCCDGQAGSRRDCHRLGAKLAPAAAQLQCKRYA
jgi:hypothetical protein